MDASEEFIPVGKITGTFGVKGWMKVFSFTEPRKNILKYSPLYLSQKGRWVEVKLTAGRVQGKGIVISLDKVDDPDQVTALIGTELAITKKQLKPLANDEYYWSDLVGLTVINLQGEQLGEVDSLLETGANDVLVVINKAQKTQCLIPFVMGDIVEKVDTDNKVITVDWEQDY
jgi:16S rRNA processing protein RimM